MYCPTCGQQQISDETRFCSRCGFLLSDVAEVIANNGISPYKTPSRLVKKDSQRKRGIKQGAMIMLVGVFLTALISVMMPLVGFSPLLIPLAAVIGFMGGILRIIYAFMFESPDDSANTFEQNIIASAQKLKGKKSSQNALPPQQSIPVTDYVQPTPGSWRETNDLVQPSVTEGTTKLLQKED